MAISRKRRDAFLALMKDREWGEEVLKGLERARADPLSFSSLGYWLRLETWTREEGILVLAGIDPQSVVESDDPSKQFVDSELW